MPIEVSYWSGSDTYTGQAYGLLVGAETVSAESAPTPDNAGVMRIEAIGDCRVAYRQNGETNSAKLFLSDGAVIDLQAEPGYKLTVESA